MKKEKTSKKTRFVAARRNSDGTLSEFKDNNGKTYDYEQALEAVEQGMIETLFHSQDVTELVTFVESTMETNPQTCVT